MQEKSKKTIKNRFYCTKNHFYPQTSYFWQQNIIFLPHLLHISKKSSNFAAGFNKKTLCQR